MSIRILAPMPSGLYRPLIGLWCERVSFVDGTEPQNQVFAARPGGRSRAFAAARRICLLRASHRYGRHRPADLRDGPAKAGRRSGSPRKQHRQGDRRAARARARLRATAPPWPRSPDGCSRSATSSGSRSPMPTAPCCSAAAIRGDAAAPNVAARLATAHSDPLTVSYSIPLGQRSVGAAHAATFRSG